jgi:predicted  nucleic acid-binding Zn-ribbon protein
MKNTQPIYLVHEIVDGNFSTVIDSVWSSEELALKYISTTYKNLKITREPFILNKEGTKETYYQRLAKARALERKSLERGINYAYSSINILELWVQDLENENKKLKNKLKELKERHER